jgi:AmmeMemoRadiSam system protein A
MLDTASVNTPVESSKTTVSDNDKKFFLALGRAALVAAVEGHTFAVPEDIPALGKEKSGCFVTLTINGTLRGCIGYIEGIKPLAEAIADNARNAALKDPRFSPVTPEELLSVRMEISVLSQPQPLLYRDAEDLLAKITPFRDGIIMQKGYHQSTFLPQVWEQLPDRISFLEHLALKAGLGKNDWKSAEYKQYDVIHFEE